MLVLKNVDVFYGRVHAIRRVSLHVNQGEIVALIGGNGAGKTTLLTTISGLMRAKEGSLAFEGREIARERPERIVAAGISQVPERRLVFKPMSVEDNLLLGAYHRYSLKNKAEIRKDIQDIYEMFPVLGQRKDQPSGNLSGGEQQMLAIGRALMTNPRLLILDEATEGLAPLIREEIWRALGILKSKGLAILVIDKNLESLLTIAQRHYIMEKGQVVWSGPTSELAAQPRLQERYLGV
jgi:branched-chain amino acid transport system ATP-binding protein